jgi:hypothetical protein
VHCRLGNEPWLKDRRDGHKRTRPISAMQRGLDSVLLFHVAQVDTLQEAYMQFDRLAQAVRGLSPPHSRRNARRVARHAGRRTDDSTDPRVPRGFEIASLPLNLAGIDRALVGLDLDYANPPCSATITTSAIPGVADAPAPSVLHNNCT